MKRPLMIAVLAVMLAACGKDVPGPVAPLPLQSVPPDFSLHDENSSSTSAGLMVSPRQMLGKVSAWYFGHAT